MKKIMLALAVVGGALAAQLLLVSNAQAQYQTSDTAVTRAEQHNYSHNIDGATWVSSPNRPYRSDIVDVPYGQRWVSVHVRGSWKNFGNRFYEVFLDNQTFETTANRLRIDPGQSGSISRGTRPARDKITWNPNAYLTGWLDVGNVCDGRAGQETTMTIYLQASLPNRRYPGGPIRPATPTNDESIVSIHCGHSPWQITGNSWVTKQYDPFDTANYGSGWVNSRSNPNKIAARPGDLVDWWHSLHITHGMSNNEPAITTGVQQDVFDAATGRQIRNAPDLNYSGAWRSYKDQRLLQAIPTSDWRGYKWNRDINNPRDFSNNWLETIHGKPLLEDVVGEIHNGKFMYNRKIRTDDLGKLICQRAYWSKANYGYNGGWTYTPYSCVDVIYEYNLQPRVNVDTSNLEENAKTVRGVGGLVVNYGITRSDRSHKTYAMARFVIRNGGHLPNFPSGEGVDASGAAGGRYDCKVVDEIARRNGFTASNCERKVLFSDDMQILSGQARQILPNGDDDVSGLNLRYGDKVCYVSMVSIYKYRLSANIFRYSDVRCVDVGKRPKVQVWGGDIKTNKSVITSTSVSQEPSGIYNYGSWGEYGIFAKDRVISSSGAGLSSDHAGVSLTNKFDINKLTFANNPNFGGFANPVVLGDFSVPEIGPQRGSLHGSVDVSGLSDGKYRAGNLTISGGKLKLGTSVLIESTGTVTIKGNISYESTNDISRLPQLIIRARNIIIDQKVTEVNSWLVTSNDGYVSTCGSVIKFRDSWVWLYGINSKTCDAPLKVNGPIMAGRLFLRRTYGGHHATPAHNDDNMHPGTPAEIINLRADAYMWSYGRNKNSGAISTMNIKELPPRY